jgi:uncharacterized membrane protein required for colicin V production
MNISWIQIFFLLVGLGYFMKTLRIYQYDNKVFGLVLGILNSILIVAIALTKVP